MRTGQKRRGGGKMAAPEERDLTQEQTEKLLQFQVAASPRCSKGRRRLGTGPLEDPRTLPRLGSRFFSDHPAAPSPPDANCLAAPEPGCPRLSAVAAARATSLSSLSGSASRCPHGRRSSAMLPRLDLLRPTTLDA